MHHQYLPLVSLLMAVCVVCVVCGGGGGGGGQCDWVQSARINVVAESEEGGPLSQNARPKTQTREAAAAVRNALSKPRLSTLAACTRASLHRLHPRPARAIVLNAETRACSDQDCPEVCGPHGFGLSLAPVPNEWR